MSAVIKVVTNSLGSGDWVVVYETNCGETVYEGHKPNAHDLFNILSAVNGIAEDVKFYELADEQMEEWQEHC